MHITTDNTNFRGTNEVKYGLKQAALAAKNLKMQTTYMCSPRPVNHDLGMNRAKGALDAYTDMIAHDDSFVETIKELTKDKEFMTTVSEFLKPIKTTLGNILYPHEDFISSLYNSTKIAKGLIPSELENFHEKIKIVKICKY